MSNLGNNREILIIENWFSRIKRKIEKISKLQVIINKNNDGYEAANLGFQQLKSKYVFMLEPDIIISKNN